MAATDEQNVAEQPHAGRYTKHTDTNYPYDYVSPSNLPVNRPPNRSFQNVGFTCSGNQVDLPLNPPKLPAAPPHRESSVYIQPASAYVSDQELLTPSAGAQQGSSSIKLKFKKRKFIMAIIIAVFLFTLFVAACFIFMGMYLTGKTRTTKNSSGGSTLTTPANYEAISWTTSTPAAMTPEVTHDSIVFSTPHSDETEPTDPERACESATNLTEYWRSEHDGANLQLGTGEHDRYGYTCDLYEELQWFRFTGAAGNRFLNTCPPPRSCGGYYSYWTDADMPQQSLTISPILIYKGTSQVTCKGFVRMASVIRCSLNTDHDFVYRVHGKKYKECVAAFCGMR